MSPGESALHPAQNVIRLAGHLLAEFVGGAELIRLVDRQMPFYLSTEGGDARVVHQVQHWREFHDLAHVLDQ